MAIMASQPATSSKKHGAHESHDERDAKKTRPSESGTAHNDKAAHKPSNAEVETEDDTLENPYDNVACTD
jgi:hypothetical protein